MEFALILRELTRRRWALAIGVLVAAAAATLSVYRIDGTSLKPRSLQHSSASTQVLVDSRSSVLGNVGQSFEPLATRALVYANFMTSPVVLDIIGKQVGLSGEQIYAAGPVSAQEPRVEQEPTALKRNVEISGETKPYRLNFESQGNLPTIGISSQAPTTSQAVALANAAVIGMERYVASVEAANNVPPASRVVIRQLGPASGAVDDAGIRKSLAALVFVGVFLLWCILVLLASRFREAWRETAPRALDGDAEEAVDVMDLPERATSRDEYADAPGSPLFDAPSLRERDRPVAPARSIR
jgi:hypothetical protein